MSHLPKPGWFFVSLLVPTLLTAACNVPNEPSVGKESGGADDTESGSTDSSTGPDTVSSLTAECDFGPPSYILKGEGLDYLIAAGESDPNCQFAFQFAERLGDGSIADIAAEGDTAKVFDIPGFMIAAVQFSCNANSSGVCTADRGEIRLVIFPLTQDDLEVGSVSRKRILIEIDALGTEPGNQVRFRGTVEGTIF